MSPVTAKLVSESEPYIVPGKLKVRELWFEVPLDHAKPDGKQITLFARSAVPHEKPIVEPKEPSQRPFLVFLQGGPGFGNPLPQDSPLSKYMLDRGYELLLLDYRGTGLSSTVSADTLASIGTPQEQADYLKHFRADTIVKDCEAVRRYLTKDYPPEKQKWSIFGQSFGGMTSMTYLSFAPEGLRESFITGGLAALDKGPDDVYPVTYKTVITRNKAYYKKFPGDVATVKWIASKIEELGGAKGIPLPAGGLLTVKLLMLLGINFGADGGIDKVHNLMVRMKADLDQFGRFTRATLNIIEQEVSNDEAPIYMLLHEPCWIYGPGIAGNFAADRVGKSFKEYQWLQQDWEGVSALQEDEPLYFLGEMMPEYRLDTCAELMKLKDTVRILAKYDQWPALYDLEQLARNEVPVYAACYNDMYVDSDMARVTASRIQGIKVFETNVLFHGAIRSKPDEVFRELLKLRDDTID
ncbi:Alpha/Beta hydrolase protein [Microdochium trichocladiopsis]|uniref:Alpha/Beta hydrolase protein n=1 Tax=Microdochium trichocladiopsis TaxID=1682393 RepID=A0A9P8YAX0_9PEZI|nr:Alpha/Beta hydrolase protein [Microdochium trichocladiopsis]KAH7035031.1 Alpha/Beta hydrolase protein [Microdochium trichocladiopsis]